ncbi:MAG TPA: hypothetical protein VNQ79_18685 [Blastocatellia bacterium]|nr:hypothetical protein [Blastocatellia bacterium]
MRIEFDNGEFIEITGSPARLRQLRKLLELGLAEVARLAGAAESETEGDYP